MMLQTGAKLIGQLLLLSLVATVTSAHPHITLPSPGLGIPDPGCPIDWQPSPLLPVFYGYEDVPIETSAKTVRVFFPTLDHSPQNAHLLRSCGRYPLVLFVHGDTSNYGQSPKPDHIDDWTPFLGALARTGYVIVAPTFDHGGGPFGPNPSTGFLEEILLWMRSTWPHADQLLPPPMTAIIGHSWGGVLGGFLASRWHDRVGAYVSLSGGWNEGTEAAETLMEGLTAPSLFVWGTGTKAYGQTEESSELSLWDLPMYAKHRLTIMEGEHWDYLLPELAPPAWVRGQCDVHPLLTEIFVSLFLGHYLPPENWPFFETIVDHYLLAHPQLFPPLLELTNDQNDYYGTNWINTYAQTDCSLENYWRIGTAHGGYSTSVPP